MKAILAPDRMSTDQLWRLADRLYYDVEPYYCGTRDLRARQVDWRKLGEVLRELRLRGVQLELPLGKGE